MLYEKREEQNAEISRKLGKMRELQASCTMDSMRGARKIKRVAVK